MKTQVLYLMVLVSAISGSCKKDNENNSNCDRIAAFNSRKMVYDNNGRLSEFTSETAGKVTVTYENFDKTITLRYSTGSEKLQLDNQRYFIKAEIYDGTGKRLQSKTIGRNSQGYSTDEVIEVYKPDGTLDQRVAYKNSNFFDANGNLIKTVSVRPGFAADSVEYIYDIGRNVIKFISSEGDLLFETNPHSKNLLLKEKFNNKDHYVYSFTTDTKGRVIYNKCTPLTSSGTGYENNIQYECD